MNANYWAISHAESTRDQKYYTEMMKAREAKKASEAKAEDSRRGTEDFKQPPVCMDIFAPLELNTSLTYRHPQHERNGYVQAVLDERFIFQRYRDEMLDPCLELLEQESLTREQEKLYTKTYQQMLAAFMDGTETKFLDNLELEILDRDVKIDQEVVAAHDLFLETEWTPKYKTRVEKARSLCASIEEGDRLHDRCLYWCELLFFHDNCHAEVFKRKLKERPSFYLDTKNEQDPARYRKLVTHFENQNYKLSKHEFRQLIWQYLDTKLERVLEGITDSCELMWLKDLQDVTASISNGNDSHVPPIVNMHSLGVMGIPTAIFYRSMFFVPMNILFATSVYNAVVNAQALPPVVQVQVPPAAVNPFHALVVTPDFVPAAQDSAVDNEWGLVDTRQPPAGSRDGDY